MCSTTQTFRRSGTRLLSTVWLALVLGSSWVAQTEALSRDLSAIVGARSVAGSSARAMFAAGQLAGHETGSAHSSPGIIEFDEPSDPFEELPGFASSLYPTARQFCGAGLAWGEGRAASVSGRARVLSRGPPIP